MGQFTWGHCVLHQNWQNCLAGQKWDGNLRCWNWFPRDQRILGQKVLGKSPRDNFLGSFYSAPLKSFCLLQFLQMIKVRYEEYLFLTNFFHDLKLVFKTTFRRGIIHIWDEIILSLRMLCGIQFFQATTGRQSCVDLLHYE